MEKNLYSIPIPQKPAKPWPYQPHDSETTSGDPYWHQYYLSFYGGQHIFEKSWKYKNVDINYFWNFASPNSKQLLNLCLLFYLLTTNLILSLFEFASFMHLASLHRFSCCWGGTCRQVIKILDCHWLVACYCKFQQHKVRLFYNGKSFHIAFKRLVVQTSWP